MVRRFASQFRVYEQALTVVLALAQVRLRQAALFDGKAFWRTLVVSKYRTDIADLVASAAVDGDGVVRLQRDDGRWSVLADKPRLTSAPGEKHGWLGAEAPNAAKKTWVGLRAHLRRTDCSAAQRGRTRRRVGNIRPGQ